MAKDYYQILGVPKSSTKEEISKAFKKLARKYHPDMNSGDKKSEEKFKEITEANEVLSNPEKRKKYDTFGSADFEGFPGGGNYTYRTNTGPFGGGGGTVDFDLGDLGDIFGDIMGGGGIGGGAKSRKRGFRSGPGFHQPQRGKDLTFTLELDFLDAATGCEKSIRLPNNVSFKVRIPAGVRAGSRIRLGGKGEPGLQGGPAGDLFLEPKIKPHPYFRLKEDDIELDVPITISEALFGATIEVPTLSGKVDLKIPASSQSGQKMRLKGKGVLNAKTKTHGDQFVILEIHVPTHLDTAAKQELQKTLEGKETNPRKWSS